MALADFQTLVDNLVRDDSGEIATADRDAAIELAVVRYSTDRPVPAIEEVAAAGGVFLPLPAGWEARFSRLTGLALSDGEDPQPFAGVVEQGLAGERIRMELGLAAATPVIVKYTVKHAVDAGGDTVPVADREAVAGWAAALLLEQLSSLYAGNRQPTIAADTVDWQSKSRDYAARAKTLRQSYLNQLGIDDKRQVPAGAVVNLDMGDSRGNDRIVHRGRFR
ncbi:hypothetical protein [Shumkonia mesophila]|uniref:hypothetical protein n=1 Tax=Shumkonia mesophila TaxID=2838854 RepID=UPI0029348AC0|nr:hypothetical protein [Shumkonia mesophila]